ncbi:MAG: lysophospholipid acyltransferase family protein [Mycobacteriales bacterium]
MRSRRIGFWYRLAVVLVKPPAILLTRHDWRGLENLPRAGGVIVAANHHSDADPFTVAHVLYDAGRLPRFLAKSEVFSLPVAGRILRGIGQIPVRRHTADAADVLAAAVAAVRAGELVVVYPEGTLTKDPGRWPMRARTGVARLALTTGAPVIPLAQWGTHLLHDRKDGMHLLRRPLVATRLGPPVDLNRFQGEPQTAEVLREATDAIMKEVRELLGELRGERPPARVWDSDGGPEAAERRWP